jgi:hypothetical protein
MKRNGRDTKYVKRAESTGLTSWKNVKAEGGGTCFQFG